MSFVDAIIFMLGCAVLLVLLTRRFAFPYPSVLVLGGLVVALVPGVPRLAIQPSAALSIFLPAVLFQEASRISWGELRRSALLIGVVGPVLIIGSCAAVAGLATLMFPGIPLAVAVVIGAVVAPADAMASRAVLARLKAPNRIIAVLVGEGLVNDAVAVVIYKVAVAAVLGSVVSLGGAVSDLAILTLGGLVYGVVVGLAGGRLLRASGDAMIYCVTSLTLAFLTYVTAEALNVSGALATVAAGMMCSRGVGRTPAAFRLNAAVMWQIITFALNAIGFLLIGAQLPSVLADLRYYEPMQLLGYGAAMCATVLGARLVILMAATGVETFFQPPSADRRRTWRENVVIGWSGMRGLVTLAAALGLPLTPEGSVFPYRDLTLFFAFAAILSTLFGQGMTLAPIVRALKIEADVGDGQRRLARRAAAEAALVAVDRCAAEAGVTDDALGLIRAEYASRIARLDLSDAVAPNEGQSSDSAKLRAVALAAERRAIMSLGRSGVIGEDVAQELLTDMDVSEMATAAQAL